MKYLNIIIQVVIALILIEALFAQAPQCNTEDDCNNHGKCKNSTCICDGGYVTRGDKACDYKQKDKLVTFLLSFFVGSFGADWFYLASGSTTYIIVGVVKLLTGVIGIGIPCFLGCAGCLRSDGSKVALFACIVVLIVLSTTANAVWWLADWIRILVGTFNDGNGIGLKDW